MRVRRAVTILVAVASIVAETQQVRAEPIVYSLEFVASGRLGWRPFRNERVVLTAFSDTEPISIDDVPTNVDHELGRLTQALASVAYLFGFLLTVATLFKFRQHRDNPHQVQMQLGGTSGVPDGAVVATLSADALRNYTLGEQTRRIVTSVSLLEPLELPLTRDDRVRTLRIDSIRGNRVELRAEVIAPAP